MANHTLVLDAGPLLLWLSYSYLKTIRAARPIRNEVLLEIGPPQWSEEEHEQFLRYLGQHSLASSSHVFAEVLRLRETTYLGRNAERFRELSLPLLYAIDERWMSLQVLRDASEERRIAVYGLTDTALLQLAQQLGAVLVTNDERLYAALPSDPRFSIRLTRHCVK